MEQIQAMDLLVGKAMATIRAVEVALQQCWTRVIFKSNSKLFCDDPEQLPPCWKIDDLVLSLIRTFKAQSAWALHLVPGSSSSCSMDGSFSFVWL